MMMVKYCGLSISVLLTLGGVASAAPATVPVAAGDFWMGADDGADDEGPVHPVQVGEFWIDTHEVTNARYRECVEAQVCRSPALTISRHRPDYFWDAKFADYPVIFVSWQQADAFCRFAGGRLPTEAEWEKAARGPAPSLNTYPWGDTLPDCEHANMAGCIGDTDGVGRRPLGQSPYGVMDMAGNVWEWVADWYDARYYQAVPLTDPQGPGDGTLKVMRGGCWESGAQLLRVSCRRAEIPRAWADNVGFRCVYDARGGR